MVLGWRRAFCTSIPRDPQPNESNTTNSSPKPGTKFGGLSSNPSTPRFETHPSSSPGLRSRTTAPATVQATEPVPESPKVKCNKTKNSPRCFNLSSNLSSSSPRTASTFSLLKSSLRLSKSQCGICLQSVKTGQGTAIFKAECCHIFHFPCIASHINKQSQLACPVCSSIWKEVPDPFSVPNQKSSSMVDEKKRGITARIDVKAKKKYQRSDLKVYNDDEPLRSPTSVIRFNSIPEDGDSEKGLEEEFPGFFASPIEMNSKIEVKSLSEAAVVSIGRSYETYTVILKVKAPPAQDKATCHAPIDLVAVLDVSGSMTAEKIQMMKSAMRLLVSSLSSADRLSVVAFSASSKRLLPLRRMTTSGRRSARQLIDALAVLDGMASANDTLKKAVKVLEDRRERNPVSRIMILCDGHNRPSYDHLDIPVHSIGLNQGGAQSENEFAKYVGGLLSPVVQDLRLQLGLVSGSSPAKIAAVYSCTTRPELFKSDSVQIGDLYANDERELLVELKVPSPSNGGHHILSVRCCYKDPSTEEVIYCRQQALEVPRPATVRSSAPSIQRLRRLFITKRALAESRKLAECKDLSGAHRMLSSARALLLKSSSASAEEFVSGLDKELLKLHRTRRQIQNERSRSILTEKEIAFFDEKGKPLTPISAWRAAERLAKVATKRKSLTRVSDLHGFEDARF